MRITPGKYLNSFFFSFLMVVVTVIVAGQIVRHNADAFGTAWKYMFVWHFPW